MNRSLLALLLLTLAMPALAYNVAVRYVYDGDTILVVDAGLPAPLKNLSIRLRGIDTPELRGQCQAEKDKALLAKNYLKSVVGKNQNITLTNYKWDKYGGRIDAMVNVDGVDLSTTLIAAGYAVAYDGTGARKNWCN
jgi:micrococcal nuclease